MQDCLFCKIVRDEIPSRKIYESADVLAFYDIAPKAKTHVLIIPKRHISSLLETTEGDVALMGRLLHEAQQIARQEGVAESGFRLVNNCGRHGGQEVFHLHFHLLGGEALGMDFGSVADV